MTGRGMNDRDRRGHLTAYFLVLARPPPIRPRRIDQRIDPSADLSTLRCTQRKQIEYRPARRAGRETSRLATVAQAIFKAISSPYRPLQIARSPQEPAA